MPIGSHLEDRTTWCVNCLNSKVVFSCWNGLIIEFWHFIWFFHLPLRLDYSWHLLEMHLHTRDQCLVPEVRGDGSVLARVDIDAHGSLNWPCERRPDPMPNVYGELNEFEWFRIQVLEKNRKSKVIFDYEVKVRF